MVIIWVWWVIDQITEEQSYLNHNGTPRKVSFSIELSYFGNDWK